eukprot:CAMPEP_0184655920 /NCGR_PEP_ID=MMETSP0308-20130426/14932_1 /TAXON_ID=38269 /ORGANISM="Gloeochaete witrockiana, Strain SAG 46.84" /LENGTH=129 /DNA_ID=CAMNT_0027092741 /DNA_START=39 /DNA_END=428 /DNA_ORIENTATION=+
MADTCTVTTKGFKVNPLLGRRQFVLEVSHPGRGTVAKAELKKVLAKMYNVEDATTIFVFGFKSIFGGGRSTGFGLIYDNLVAAKRFEPKYRLKREKLLSETRMGSKQRKERKNRAKKTRGKKVKKTKKE